MAGNQKEFSKPLKGKYSKKPERKKLDVPMQHQLYKYPKNALKALMM